MNMNVIANLFENREADEADPVGRLRMSPII